MKIVKVWANIGPGHQGYDETYLFFNEKDFEVEEGSSDEQQLNEVIEDSANEWAEDKHGWTSFVVDWEIVEKADKHWLNTHIESMRDQIEYLKTELELMANIPSEYMLPHDYNVWDLSKVTVPNIKTCKDCVFCVENYWCEKWKADVEETGRCSSMMTQEYKDILDKRNEDNE